MAGPGRCRPSCVASPKLSLRNRPARWRCPASASKRASKLMPPVTAAQRPIWRYPPISTDLNQSNRFLRRVIPTSWRRRSEEHTSELQSLMRISYAVFCLKKKQNNTPPTQPHHIHHTHTHPPN